MRLQRRLDAWSRASAPIASRHNDHSIVKRSMDSSRWVFVVIFAVLAIVLVGSVIFIRFRRKKNAGKPQATDKQQPGFFGRLFGSSGGSYSQTPGAEEGNAHQLSTANAQSNNAVNRNTSVRSVITLPAYRHTASHEERVLGYEGDRDGVDTIVDLPNEEDDEALRDQEMETLYQIRQVRRDNQAERNELRRLRDDARARNDHAALAALRTRPQANNNREAIRELREEVERIKDNRQRSVSSVSYAGLGVTRHDGSRVRANSNESERMGLLSDAASMGARAGATSPQPSHNRGRSASSIISMDSDMPSPGLTRTNASGDNTPRVSIGGNGAGSSPELVEADLGDEMMRPPEYEDVPLDVSGRASPYERSITPLNELPPGYSGPVRSDSQQSVSELRAEERQQGSSDSSRRSSRGVGGTPQLPSLRLGRLPSIVIEPSSALPRDDDER